MYLIIRTLKNCQTIRKYVLHLFHLSNIRHFSLKHERPILEASAYVAKFEACTSYLRSHGVCREASAFRLTTVENDKSTALLLDIKRGTSLHVE